MRKNFSDIVHYITFLIPYIVAVDLSGTAAELLI